MDLTPTPASRGSTNGRGPGLATRMLMRSSASATNAGSGTTAGAGGSGSMGSIGNAGVTATKRDSQAAELERGAPSSKRLHVPSAHPSYPKSATKALNTTLSAAALSRQLLTLQTAQIELEAKLRERDMTIERLERDRRWLAEREEEERVGRERERAAWVDEKATLQHTLRTLRTSLSALNEQHADLEDAHSALVLSSSQASSRSQAEMRDLARRVRMLEGQVDESRTLADERGTALSRMEEMLTLGGEGGCAHPQCPSHDQEDDGEAHEVPDEEAHEDDVDMDETRPLSARPSLFSHSSSHRLSLAHRRSQTPDQADSRRSDNALILAELTRQTAHLHTLESTNTRLSSELAVLRGREKVVGVLEEEMKGLKGKVGRLEGALAEREREIERLKERDGGGSCGLLDAREGAATPQQTPTRSSKHAPPPSTTPSIKETNALATLRLTHAQLLAQHGVLKSELVTAQAQLSGLEEALEEAEARVDALERDLKNEREGEGSAGSKGWWEARWRREKEGREKAEGEGRFLRGLVASYTVEAQQSHSSRQTIPAPGAENIDDLHARHIKHLEELVDEYRSANEDLMRQLDEAGNAGVANASSDGKKGDIETKKDGEEKLREMEDRLRDSQTEITTHLERVDALEQQLFELQGEIAGGRHVPPGVRVLQLRDNPESQWAELRQAALDRLRSENEALMRRLKEVEEARGVNSTHEGSAPTQASGAPAAEGDLVPRASWDLLSREKSDLEELLRQKDKRLMRLKEVYNAKGAEFRDAIASVLGVKLSFKPNGQVRVTSVYDLCASFVFQPASSASGGAGSSGGQDMRMQLVAQGDGGPQDLPDLMQFWIGKEQCIPGFMASVTLECYENAKRQGAVDGV